MKSQTATPGRQRTHVMVTLSPELRDRVAEIAKEEDRSMTSVCRRFVEQGLRKKTRRPANQH